MFTEVKTIATAIALAALVALASWWHISRVHAAEKAVHAHYAGVLAGISEKTAAAEKSVRATETAWRSSIEKEARDGQDRIDAARRAAGAARDERDRMLIALNRYRAAARAAANPGAPAAGPAAGDALDLFADLFARADAEAGELAEAADLAHAAGLTCERAYDALIKPSRPDGGTTESKP